MLRAATGGLVYAVLVGLLLPVLWLSVSSFRTEADIVATPYFLSRGVTFANYRELWELVAFRSALFNSCLLATATTLVTALVTLPTGYLLARYRFPGRTGVRGLAFSGYLLAPAVLALPYFEILRNIGLYDSLLGIVLLHTSFCFPFALALAELAVGSIPDGLEEMAMLDGSSTVRRLLRVVLPSLRYQIAAIFVLVFAISWKEFFYAFLVYSGSDTITLTVLLSGFYGSEAQNWRLVFALSTILALPSFLLFIAGRRIAPIALGGAGTRG